MTLAHWTHRSNASAFWSTPASRLSQASVVRKSWLSHLWPGKNHFNRSRFCLKQRARCKTLVTMTVYIRLSLSMVSITNVSERNSEPLKLLISNTWHALLTAILAHHSPTLPALEQLSLLFLRHDPQQQSLLSSPWTAKFIHAIYYFRAVLKWCLESRCFPSLIHHFVEPFTVVDSNLLTHNRQYKSTHHRDYPHPLFLLSGTIDNLLDLLNHPFHYRHTSRST